MKKTAKIQRLYAASVLSDLQWFYWLIFNENNYLVKF